MGDFCEIQVKSHATQTGEVGGRARESGKIAKLADYMCGVKAMSQDGIYCALGTVTRKLDL